MAATEKAKKLKLYEARAGAFGGRLPPATFAAWALFACGPEKFSGKILTDSNKRMVTHLFGAGAIYLLSKKKLADC